ncbi:hypothetical protein [Marinigracilibium pacificum]|uniref:Yip1 domain-containing protein n=1 Tax=Marinigracilibium pacificum TaxID=2729599 RepID=A0A848IWZ8_9BACT|nr:hypothetical protein [Marinigracilibium pacificum]NMM47805.1 hypothetical protein [Marinigracilibium pacificum]
MTDYFLRAKHWQIFVLSYGLPILCQMILMSSLFITVSKGNFSDPTQIFEYFIYYPIIILISSGVIFGWNWSISVGLQKFLPDNVTLKVSRFKILYFIPLIYFIIFIIGFIYLFNYMLHSPNETPDPSSFIIGFSTIFPIHLFSMFCIFYCLYFCAKTIKCIELQREVKFSDFVGEFFLLWFFPIGVWILQPKINEIISTNKST